MSEPCTSIHRIAQLERRDESIMEALKKMEDRFDSKLDLILFQINKIAVLEANHNNQSASISRAFTKIEDLEVAMVDIQAFKNHTKGMAKMAWFLWGAMSGAIGFLVIKVFLH